MPRRRAVEDPVSHERWLVSYADFITLLFAFFVVMYSISQVNEGKYKVLSETLTHAFTSTRKDTGESPQDRTLKPIQVGNLAKSNPLSLIKLKAPIVEHKNGDDNTGHAGVGTQHGGLPRELKQLSEQLREAFGDLIKSDKITLRGNQEWLEVELRSSLLFDSGDATLSDQALELLGGIAKILKTTDHPVRVEGFTDNVPIHTAQFPSNWELSTARAAAVVKLFAEEGLDPSRFAAVGYGEYQPVASNATPEGRAKNRRVTLMISKTGTLRPILHPVTGADLSAPPKPAPNANPAPQTAIPGDRSDGTAAPQATAKPPIPTPATTPAPPSGENDSEMRGVKTVELKNGGLLFTKEGERNADGEKPKQGQ